MGLFLCIEICDPCIANTQPLKIKQMSIFCNTHNKQVLADILMQFELY